MLGCQRVKWQSVLNHREVAQHRRGPQHWKTRDRVLHHLEPGGTPHTLLPKQMVFPWKFRQHISYHDHPCNMSCDEVIPGVVHSLSTGPTTQNSSVVVQPIFPILCDTVIHCDGLQCLRFLCLPLGFVGLHGTAGAVLPAASVEVVAELVALTATEVAVVVLVAVADRTDFDPKKGFGWAWRTQFTKNPIVCIVRMLLSKGTTKGTTVRLAHRQEINSFSILGVAYTARHGLVNNTQEGRKEGQMGACTIQWVTVQDKMGNPGFPDWGMVALVTSKHRALRQPASQKLSRMG